MSLYALPTDPGTSVVYIEGSGLQIRIPTIPVLTRAYSPRLGYTWKLSEQAFVLTASVDIKSIYYGLFNPRQRT